MNSFGRIFRVSVLGESHGPFVGVVIDGCPAGIPISEADFDADLRRRQGGNLTGTTTRKESDSPNFISGIFNGKTTGAPLAINFVNSNVVSSVYDQQRDIPRPGHADFTAAVKFKGYQDYRGGGHFSGRLTVCLVAAGVVAKKIIEHRINNAEVNIQSKLISAGGNNNIENAIEQAIKTNDSIGGIVECRVTGLPVGLGEPFFDSLESVIAHLAFSIPAIKGIEFGSGFASASMKGSEHNDAIIDTNGKTATNHSGGINGGLSNGNELVFRVAVKPASSTPQTQHSMNFTSESLEAFTVKGRHDLCIALRVPVVLEAITAISIADMLCVQH